MRDQNRLLFISTMKAYYDKACLDDRDFYNIIPHIMSKFVFEYYSTGYIKEYDSLFKELALTGVLEPRSLYRVNWENRLKKLVEQLTEKEDEENDTEA